MLALVGGACRPSTLNIGEGSSVSAEQVPWRFAGVDGVELITRHYHIYTTSDNRSLHAHLPGFMETANREYRDLTGLGEPRRAGEPLLVYLLATRRQWAALTEQLTGPMSALYLKVETGGYCFAEKCVLWDLGHFATFAVAAHEGLHQFLQRRLRDGLPSWAEEGLATQMEGFHLTDNGVRFNPGNNALRESDLRTAIASQRWLGVPALLTTDAGEQIKGEPLTAPQYYGQVWALMRFIHTQPGYRAGFQRMLADAEAGKLPGPDVPPRARLGRQFRRAIALPVFQRYIDSDLAGFDRRFRQYADGLARLGR